MADQFDRAAEIEILHRNAALARQKTLSQTASSTAHDCFECGEPIPQARRAAAPGCQYCLHCQQDKERHAKTYRT